MAKTKTQDKVVQEIDTLYAELQSKLDKISDLVTESMNGIRRYQVNEADNNGNLLSNCVSQLDRLSIEQLTEAVSLESDIRKIQAKITTLDNYVC